MKCGLIFGREPELEEREIGTFNVNPHHIAIVGPELELIADVLELVEEKQPHDPEEAADYEDHHYEPAVNGAMHLQRVFS